LNSTQNFVHNLRDLPENTVSVSWYCIKLHLPKPE
jgi:hypothetical protein